MRALFFFATLLASSTAFAERRIAVVVGSNAAIPGRQELRYAHKDAERLAGVLRTVGHFAPKDVSVLIGSTPDAVREALRDLHGDLVFFYFSGHADAEAMYIDGKPLPFSEVRDILDKTKATVRVGVVDACRGGGFTRAKGLSEAPAVELPPILQSEGSAYIASSSGLENAHESSTIEGSFFTHYFSGGLLGAADRSGDGRVTLQEAFDYARERTIRDSARYAPELQHPSFAINLQGREDLVLSEPASNPSAMEVTQKRGPLEVIHLPTGLVVAELPSGQRKVKLALAPGKYLVRHHDNEQVRMREVTLVAGRSERVDEAELELVGTGLLAYKGDTERLFPRPSHTTPPARILQIQLAGGLGSDSGFGNGLGPKLLLKATYGITDRLSWLVGFPAFAYRLGERGRGKVELVPYGGLTSFSLGAYDGAFAGHANLRLGADGRIWFRDNFSLILGLDANLTLQRGRPHSGGAMVFGLDGDSGPVLVRRWGRPEVDGQLRMRGAASLSATFKNFVTLNVGVSLSGNALYDWRAPQWPQPATERNLVLSIGSVSQLGMRDLPLLSFQFKKWFSLDAYAALLVDLRTGQVGGFGMMGVTFAF